MVAERETAEARAIVLLDHGSREPDANAQLEALAGLLAQRVPGQRVATAHLGVATPGLAEAVADCVRGGAREVVVLPCFIAPGKHVREDLPRLAAELARVHPGVSIRVAEPLGAHPAVADALADRLVELDRRAAPPRSKP